MKDLIIEAIYKYGYEILFFDKHEKKWYNFEKDITDEEIKNERYTFYFKPIQTNQ